MCNRQLCLHIDPAPNLPCQTSMSSVPLFQLLRPNTLESSWTLLFLDNPPQSICKSHQLDLQDEPRIWTLFLPSHGPATSTVCFLTSPQALALTPTICPWHSTQTKSVTIRQITSAFCSKPFCGVPPQTEQNPNSLPWLWPWTDQVHSSLCVCVLCRPPRVLFPQTSARCNPSLHWVLSVQRSSPYGYAFWSSRVASHMGQINLA